MHAIGGGSLIRRAARASVAAALVATLAGVRSIGTAYAVVTPQLTATLPFGDTFTASDGSELSAYWTDQRGNITVQGGAATGTGGTSNVATVNGIDRADVTVSAAVNLSPGQDVGLVARYSGPLESHFYLGRLTGTPGGFQATIWRNGTGTYTKLATGLTVGGAPGTLTFEAVGPSLKLLLGGQVLAVASDSALTSGSVGIRLGPDATVDDFSAAAV